MLFVQLENEVSGNDNRPEIMFVKTSSSFYYAEQKLEIDYRAGQTVKPLVSFLLNIFNQ